MSAFGRLWRRAPLWRTALVLTVGSCALTLLYPPAWFGGYRSVVDPRAGVSGPVPGAALGPTVGRLPLAGDVVSGSLPLGPQVVPLPAGRWTVLAVGQSGGGQGAAQEGSGQSGVAPAVEAVLGLVLGGRLEALAVFSGPIAADPAEAGFPAPLEIQTPAFYYRRVLASVDHGPLDVWLCGPSAPAKWGAGSRQAALGVLARQGIAVPERLDTAVFRLANRRVWLSADIGFPGEAGAPDRPWVEAATISTAAGLPHLEAVRRWAKVWHEVARRGFAGDVRAAENARIPLP